jgi:hypothetical protein
MTAVGKFNPNSVIKEYVRGLNSFNPQERHIMLADIRSTVGPEAFSTWYNEVYKLRRDGNSAEYEKAISDKFNELRQEFQAQAWAAEQQRVNLFAIADALEAQAGEAEEFEIMSMCTCEDLPEDERFLSIDKDCPIHGVVDGSDTGLDCKHEGGRSAEGDKLRCFDCGELYEPRNYSETGQVALYGNGQSVKGYKRVDIYERELNTYHDGEYRR